MQLPLATRPFLSCDGSDVSIPPSSHPPGPERVEAFWRTGAAGYFHWTVSALCKKNPHACHMQSSTHWSQPCCLGLGLIVVLSEILFLSHFQRILMSNNSSSSLSTESFQSPISSSSPSPQNLCTLPVRADLPQRHFNLHLLAWVCAVYHAVIIRQSTSNKIKVW